VRNAAQTYWFDAVELAITWQINATACRAARVELLKVSGEGGACPASLKTKLLSDRRAIDEREDAER